MANEARDVEIDILARDKTGPGVKSAGDNFDKLNDRVRKTTKKVGQEAGKAGLSAGTAFGDSLRAGFARAAPAIAPVLAGVAIAAAPVMGATISAAVIGGAAGGGIIGGVLIASRDARVQAAGKLLGESLLSQLEDSAVAFVGPIIDATHEIRASFRRAGSDIDGILRKSATFVKPLTQGATYAFERITRGINKLVQNAGPVITALRDGMANVGESVEDVFDSLSDNGIEAASALSVAFGALEVTIRTVGAVVNGLTEAYGFLARWGAFGKDVAIQYRAMEASAKHAKDANEQTGGSFNRVAEAASGAAAEIKTYTQVLDEARGNNLNLMEAQARATLAIGETTAKIKENNKEYKNSAERSAANRIALAGLVESFDRVREAQAKANGVTVDSIPYTAAQRQAFIAAANAAGIYGADAEYLADQLLGIPKSTNAKVNVAAEEAKRDAIETKRHLNAIKGTYNATVKVNFVNFQPGVGVKVKGGTITKYDAVSHFYAADNAEGQARSRAGGPTPVSVTSNVQVDLDGEPFRAYTVRAVDAAERRSRWRAAVGSRA